MSRFPRDGGRIGDPLAEELASRLDGDLRRLYGEEHSSKLRSSAQD